MDITTSLAAARLAPLSGTEAAVAAPQAAATAQFAALMQAPLAEAGPAAPALAPTAGAVAPTSVGDRILNGMQGISSELRATWAEVSDTLRADRAELSMQEMMGLQLRLTQASVGIELLGKAVSRSTQNFDQLVRVQ